MFAINYFDMKCIVTIKTGIKNCEETERIVGCDENVHDEFTTTNRFPQTSSFPAACWLATPSSYVHVYLCRRSDTFFEFQASKIF